ncbi:MAG: PAS domain-containing protein [Vicinamibacteria bacterium]
MRRLQENLIAMTATSAEAKAAALSRFLDALDHAHAASARAYDQAFNQPPKGFSVHEILPDKTFTRISPGHTTMLGYEPSQLVGRHASDFVVLKETSERAITRKMSPSAVLLPFNRTWRKSDGSEITLLMLDRHIKNAEGQIVGIRTAITEA